MLLAIKPRTGSIAARDLLALLSVGSGVQREKKLAITFEVISAGEAKALVQVNDNARGHVRRAPSRTDLLFCGNQGRCGGPPLSIQFDENP